MRSENDKNSPAHLVEAPQMSELQDTCCETDGIISLFSDVTAWFQICPYPRYEGHPYKTGDWTEWWGVCRRASGQSGPIKPRGCGPSSSSCTLRRDRLGQTRKRLKTCVSVQLARMMLYHSWMFQLTGPEVGIGAHHAHDQWAGDPPCQSRALWEWPSDLQGHRRAPQTLHPHINLHTKWQTDRVYTWCSKRSYMTLTGDCKV